MHQMHQASKLPVSVAGALMPDAHAGYGLPIGGVLATENAVIPYGVGVDIGCRMCLSVFDIDPKDLVQKEQYFTRELNEATLFGSGRDFEHPTAQRDYRKEFDEIDLLVRLQKKAANKLDPQVPESFVEFER
jgi:tRNA-splicing ligase RtcB